MAQIDAPIPVSDIESVLSWVDTFKLSRPHKKINRDFSDAVLLAEILNYHYPKLVEMHNYPPRNSHSLKLNNWMTLNRKVLKKLKLQLCCNTMEQLANCAAGVIERVLVMVREKIRRDEEANKLLRDDPNLSSGGSYYEACGDEEHVLVVPMKTRVNGVLETIQQKVVSYDAYCVMKEQLKDAKEAAEVLKQKVEHLDNLLSLKEMRIDELQNQLERKQARRKEADIIANTLSVPFENPPSPKLPNEVLIVKAPSKSMDFNIEQVTKAVSMTAMKTESRSRLEESKIPIAKDSFRSIPRQDYIKPEFVYDSEVELDIIRSDIFNETVEKGSVYHDFEDLDAPDDIMTIEETIQREIKDINEKTSGQDIKNIQETAFEYVRM